MFKYKLLYNTIITVNKKVLNVLLNKHIDQIHIL